MASAPAGVARGVGVAADASLTARVWSDSGVFAQGPPSGVGLLLFACDVLSVPGKAGSADQEARSICPRSIPVNCLAPRASQNISATIMTMDGSAMTG